MQKRDKIQSLDLDMSPFWLRNKGEKVGLIFLRMEQNGDDEAFWILTWPIDT